MLKSLLDIAPSLVAGACTHKNIASVLRPCNYIGTGVVAEAYGYKEDMYRYTRRQ